MNELALALATLFLLLPAIQAGAASYLLKDVTPDALVEAIIAVHRGDYCYYPDGGFGEPFNYPRSGWIRTDEPKSEIEGGEGAGRGGLQVSGLRRMA